MENLKFVVCTIILLGFVATIMLISGAWNTRVFIAYVVTAIMTGMICMLFGD